MRTIKDDLGMTIEELSLEMCEGDPNLETTSIFVAGVRANSNIMNIRYMMGEVIGRFFDDWSIYKNYKRFDVYLKLEEGETERIINEGILRAQSLDIVCNYLMASDELREKWKRRYYVSAEELHRRKMKKREYENERCIQLGETIEDLFRLETDEDFKMFESFLIKKMHLFLRSWIKLRAKAQRGLDQAGKKKAV